MSDQFSITPLDQLLRIILEQLENNRLFGFPSELFFKPKKIDPFRSYRYDQLLETPIGVAAGPHTQLSQNIVIAWLMGARYIELKTIQTLDEIDVSKPCIDMQDEGYNCEWSQELKVKESFEQYLDAWIIIHVLKHKFNWGDQSSPGVIFNMSVGYDFNGIQNKNVQWFLDKMLDASEELKIKKESITSIYPEIDELEINPCVSNNITLSTMHGCPVDEIEKIGKYFIEERKIHTAIKLNPTLLGKNNLHKILNDSGFDTKVPDSAFDHDPKFDEVVSILQNLEKSANENNVHFGIKLTNTLESQNNRNVFPSSEKMMYMSGRALHPISIKVAEKLQSKFNGELDISFCAGVDAFNVFDVIKCGISPVTVCSDLLKPGGYGRLCQYIEEIKLGFKESNSGSVSELILKENQTLSLKDAALVNLKKYSQNVVEDDRYKKTAIFEPNIKTERKLDAFDCINAPCVDTCPTNQDIPDYMHFTKEGELNNALGAILKTNPFPRTTGMICDHPCQSKCTLINYNSPVQIREVKRFLAENARSSISSLPKNQKKKVAIIGAGPSGLSCAYFLASSGFEVKVYEKKSKPGGMVSGAIPAFRLTEEAFDSDLDRIEDSGAKVEYDITIDKPFFKKLQKENNFIYISIGAQLSTGLDIENINAKGFLEPLQFLFDAKENKPTGIGKHVAIIGGGNTAMDAARTAYRLVGKNGTVTILYRRTLRQMPADKGEIKAVLDEGMRIMELASPIKINLLATSVAKTNRQTATEVAGNDEKRIESITCQKMRLWDHDTSGRPRPVPIPGSEFTFACDTIIPAIGQELDIDFADEKKLITKTGNYETQIENVFIGGDAMRGASTAINAIGDGRKVAEAIINKSKLSLPSEEVTGRKQVGLNEHIINRSKRTFQTKSTESPLSDRKNFNLVSEPFTETEAKKEASRCLLCDEFCSICATVCPNMAFQTYETKPQNYQVQNIIVTDGHYEIAIEKQFEITQPYQILHIADWCNECGNCTTFCPTSDAPYKIKPHLYLDKKSFDEEKNGYFINTSSDYDIIYFKRGNHQSILANFNDHFVFKTDNIAISLDADSFKTIDISTPKKGNFEIDLQEAIEMSIIMQGAKSFYK